MKSGLVSLLANESTVNAICGSRIYVNKAPQKATFPQIVITQMSSEENGSIDGGSGQLRFLNFDIDCRATTSMQAESLGNAVRTFLDDYSGAAGSSTIGAVKWRQFMTASLLGRWTDAMRHLRRHAFVGTHKMIWPERQHAPYPSKIGTRHPWMHAGTFWWFRHDHVAARFRPEMILRDRWGVEAFPGQMFPHEMAYSMWQPWEENESAWPQLNPYDPQLYEKDYSQ
jgi:hypothetical protein